MVADEEAVTHGILPAFVGSWCDAAVTTLHSLPCSLMLLLYTYLAEETFFSMFYTRVWKVCCHVSP